MASNSQGGQQQNMDIFQVKFFFENKMQKLKTFAEKLKVELNSNRIKYNQ